MVIANFSLIIMSKKLALTRLAFISLRPLDAIDPGYASGSALAPVALLALQAKLALVAALAGFALLAPSGSAACNRKKKRNYAFTTARARVNSQILRPRDALPARRACICV